jgi:hypothetical protein
MAGRNNLISASYITAATAGAGQDSSLQQQQQQRPLQRSGGGGLSSVYSCSGYWGANHFRGSPASGYDGQYTYMDEEYMRCLQTHMGWERDCGVIHLMPIAVVHQHDEEWG